MDSGSGSNNIEGNIKYQLMFIHNNLLSPM